MGFGGEGLLCVQPGRVGCLHQVDESLHRLLECDFDCRRHLHYKIVVSPPSLGGLSGHAGVQSPAALSQLAFFFVWLL